MSRSKKLVLKSLVALVLLLGVGVFGVARKKDEWLRGQAEAYCRNDLGMDLTIGSMQVGVLESFLNMQSVRLNNPPDFGDSPMLHLKEVQVVYDLQGLSENRIRLPWVKLDLQELNIVKNKVGQINLNGLKDLMKLSDESDSEMTFESIDRLELTLRKVQYIDMNNPDHPMFIDLGIEAKVFENVKGAGEVTQYVMTQFFKQLFLTSFAGE